MLERPSGERRVLGVGVIEEFMMLGTGAMIELVWDYHSPPVEMEALEVGGRQGLKSTMDPFSRRCRRGLEG